MRRGNACVPDTPSYLRQPLKPSDSPTKMLPVVYEPDELGSDWSEELARDFKAAV